MILAKVPKIEYWQMGVYVKGNGCFKKTSVRNKFTAALDKPVNRW